MLEVFIEFIIHALLLYYNLDKNHGERIHLFVYILTFNIIFNISKRIFKKFALKKELIVSEFVKACIIFTAQVLSYSVLCYYGCVNNVTNAIVMSLSSSVIMHFLNKNYIFSHN